MPPYGTSYQSPAPIGLGPQPPAPNVGGLILVSRRGLVFVSGTVKRHDDGDIALALKTPWSDGTSHVLLSELELVEKLAALVPTPNANLVTYTGVLAPAAKWRSLVVPAHERCSARGCQHGAAAAHASWIPWSDLLKRTFGVDALACACGGRLKVRAVVRGS